MKPVPHDLARAMQGPARAAARPYPFRNHRTLAEGEFEGSGDALPRGETA